MRRSRQFRAGAPGRQSGYGRVLAIVAAALAGAALIVVTQAPASLAGLALRHFSTGRIALSDTSGTIWNGQGDVVLMSSVQSGPAAADPGRGAGGADDGTATRLPGRLSWQLSASRLLLGTVALSLSDGALLDQPLAFAIDRARTATLAPNRLRLPAGVLQGLGAPWNTIGPGGELQLEWDTLHLSGSELRGALRAEWIGASSRLSPVVPFGHYRLVADGFFDGASLELETVSGPMEMIGNGTIAGGNRLHFHGSARVQAGTDAATATQLSGLISLLGRRDGDGALLNFGT